MGFVGVAGTGKVSAEVCTSLDLTEFDRVPGLDERSASHFSYSAFKALCDVHMKSMQLAGRLCWPLQQIHGNNRWGKGRSAHQQEERFLNASEGSEKGSSGLRK